MGLSGPTGGGGHEGAGAGALTSREAAPGGRVVLIGVGNEFRRDDGAGPRLAARLRGRVPPGVAVVASHGDPAALRARSPHPSQRAAGEASGARADPDVPAVPLSAGRGAGRQPPGLRMAHLSPGTLPSLPSSVISSAPSDSASATYAAS